MYRLLAVLVLLIPGLVVAQQPVSYKQLVVFGDNFSDTTQTYNATFTQTSGYDSDGNPITLADAYPSPPYGYDTGIFTNGGALSSLGSVTSSYNGVWHSQLHDLLPGIPLAEPNRLTGSQTPNNDYAWGGATSGTGTTMLSYAGHFTVQAHNLNQQVDDYLNTGHTPDATTLFVLFAGLNDLLKDGTSSTTAAANITAAAKTLIDNGAVNLLIVNAPPTSANLNAPVDTAASAFRTALAADLTTLQQKYALLGTPNRIVTLDAYQLYRDIYANPTAFGFTDVTTAAQSLLGSYGSHNGDQYLQWDGVNPTTAGHHQIALAACHALTGTVTTLTTSTATPTLASPATLTATVTTAGTYGPAPSHTPTGTVTFFYPQTVLTTTTMVPLGTAPVDPSTGKATLTTASLPAGTYTLYAVYSGDTNFPTGCNSNTLPIQVVTATASFDFTAQPTAAYLGMEEGQSVILTPTLFGNYTGPITYSCANLPRFFSCNFFNNQTLQVSNGSTSQVTQVFISSGTPTKLSTASTHPVPGNSRTPAVLTALLLAPLALSLTSRRRKLLQKAALLGAAFVLTFALTSATGCAGGGSASTPTPTNSDPGYGTTHGPGITYAAPGSYTVTLTATGNGLTVSHNYYVYIADTFDVGVIP